MPPRPRPQDARCYLCGGMQPNDREHVVPRSYFPKPTPSNLPTLPAHRGCNRQLQKDEEVFRVLTLAGAYNDPAGREVWEKQVRPMLRLEEALGFRRMLASSVSALGVYTPSGIFRGQVNVLKVPRERVEPVLEKIVRGLYCIEHGIEFLEDVEFRFYQYGPQSDRETFSRVICGLPSGPREIGRVLTYRFGMVRDDPRYSIWALFFYRRGLFIAATEPAPVLAEVVSP